MFVIYRPVGISKHYLNAIGKLCFNVVDARHYRTEEEAIASFIALKDTLDIFGPGDWFIGKCEVKPCKFVGSIEK